MASFARNISELFTIRRIDEQTGELERIKARSDALRLSVYPFECWSFHLYEGDVKKRVRAMKFSFERYIAGEMGEEMCGICDEVEFDAVSYVPLHLTRALKRGFNPSRIMAKKIADAANKPLTRSLVKTRMTKAQSGLKGDERRQNPKGAFAPAKSADVRSKRVLIVDDVVSMGATLGECIRVLLDMGAEKVIAVAYAYAAVPVGKKEETDLS